MFLIRNLSRVVLLEHVHDISREIGHILADHEGEMPKVVFLVELECLQLCLCPSVVINGGKLI
jgi:hypothetical protein